MAPAAVTPPQRRGDAEHDVVDLAAAALELREATDADGDGGAGAGAGAALLDASLLTRTLTTKPRPVPADEAEAAGGDETVATDHMVTAEWRAGRGWAAPALHPYGPLSLAPTASCLHYATECFEGLKAYRGHNGRLRLFRPRRNAERLRRSAARVSLPAPDPAQLERLMVELLAVDGSRWLPRRRPGASLYLRPALVGTQPQLGVQVPRRALLFLVLTFMPRLDAPAGGMRLHTSPADTVRAWVGSFGHAKLGANYGPSPLATDDARRRGYHQVLRLYDPRRPSSPADPDHHHPDDHRAQCTEAGASNFLVVWRRPCDGRRELLTAPLDDKLILDGVTRRSCLDLSRQRFADDDLVVTERRYTIAELLRAHAEGRLLEAFAAGTAVRLTLPPPFPPPPPPVLSAARASVLEADRRHLRPQYFICPVSQIHHRGRDIHLPLGPGDEPGDITSKLKRCIGDIMYGREHHSWGVVVPEKD